jgi:hypothetical protein
MNKELVFDFINSVVADITQKKGDVNAIAAAGTVLLDAISSDVDKASVEKLVEIVLSVVDGDSSTFLDVEDLQFLGDMLLKSLKLDDDFGNMIKNVQDAANGVLNVLAKHMDPSSPVHLEPKEVKELIANIFYRVIDLPDDLDSVEEIMAAAKKALSELDEISLDDISGLLSVAKKGLLNIASYLGEFAKDALEVIDNIYDSMFDNEENSADNKEEVVYEEVLEEPAELQNTVSIADEIKDEL